MRCVYLVVYVLLVILKKGMRLRVEHIFTVGTKSRHNFSV